MHGSPPGHRLGVTGWVLNPESRLWNLWQKPWRPRSPSGQGPATLRPTFLSLSWEVEAPLHLVTQDNRVAGPEENAMFAYSANSVFMSV